MHNFIHSDLQMWLESAYLAVTFRAIQSYWMGPPLSHLSKCATCGWTLWQEQGQVISLSLSPCWILVGRSPKKWICCHSYGIFIAARHVYLFSTKKCFSTWSLLWSWCSENFTAFRKPLWIPPTIAIYKNILLNNIFSCICYILWWSDEPVNHRLNIFNLCEKKYTR